MAWHFNIGAYQDWLVFGASLKRPFEDLQFLTWLNQFFWFCLLFQPQEGYLMVRHFQYLGWSGHREVPASKRSFLKLILQVDQWQREGEEGEGRTIVHCLWVHTNQRVSLLLPLKLKASALHKSWKNPKWNIKLCFLRHIIVYSVMFVCRNGGGRSGVFCASSIVCEMAKRQSVVDVFHAVKTLRNSKPNMVDTPVS